MNFYGGDNKDYKKMVNTLASMGSYSYAPKKLDLDIKNCETQPSKTSTKEPPMLDLKALPSI